LWRGGDLAEKMLVPHDLGSPGVLTRINDTQQRNG